jgi:DNA-binding transcriptional LysR family regulator
MSAALARLRRVFGDPLLIRSGRSFTLTPLAESLAQPLQAVLADVENVLTQRPAFDPAADARTFTLLGSDYVTFILLRHFVPALYAQAPRVTIRIQPLATDVRQSLERGDADLLVLPAEFDPDLLRFPHSRLFTDDFVGVVWAGNTEVGDALTAEEFAAIPQLANEPGQFGGLPETRLTQLGVHREIEVTARTLRRSWPALNQALRADRLHYPGRYPGRLGSRPLARSAFRSGSRSALARRSGLRPIAASSVAAA